jgi:hypothetical protein
MAKTTIGRDVGLTGPRATTHEEAARLQRDATAALDSVRAAKRLAGLKNPEADTFAENARCFRHTEK